VLGGFKSMIARKVDDDAAAEHEPHVVLHQQDRDGARQDGS
jgi:hypothetical protein